MNIVELPYIDTIEDYVVSLLRKQIYFAPILLLIIEESGIPIPVPGDIIIAYIGYEVSKGLINYWTAFIIILFSVLTGASILFFLSRRFGERVVLKFGKYLHVDAGKLKTVEKQFKKYGPLVIIFGRHIPGFRIPITIFSGISKIAYKTFIISTFISVIFWIAFYLEVGKQLGPKTVNLLKAHHVYYIALLVLVLLFIGYIAYTIQKNKKKSK